MSVIVRLRESKRNILSRIEKVFIRTPIYEAFVAVGAIIIIAAIAYLDVKEMNLNSTLVNPIEAMKVDDETRTAIVAYAAAYTIRGPSF